MSVFRGAAVAIVTPFTEENQLNLEEFGRMIDYQIKNGTDALVVCGTTGESATLSRQEKDRLIRFAVEYTGGRVPVIAGTGSNCTETAVELSVEAEKAGADGLLVVTPYYNKATQKGLTEHYTRIAEAVSLPVILYNVPGRTGCNLLPETAAALAKSVPNIVGIKEASGNISQIAKLASLTNGCFDIYSGNDDQIVPVLSLGGCGVISVLSNVAPRLPHQICQEYFDGNVTESSNLQLEAMELIEALFCEVNPIPVKTAMALQGWKVGKLRGPLSELEPQHIIRLKKAMLNCRVPGGE